MIMGNNVGIYRCVIRLTCVVDGGRNEVMTAMQSYATHCDALIDSMYACITRNAALTLVNGHSGCRAKSILEYFLAYLAVCSCDRSPCNSV